MNDWTMTRKIAIVESDDTEDRYDRNGLNFLFYWKSKYPKFKISLFTIPGRTSKPMLDLLFVHRAWIEILVHGYTHSSNFECYGWDYDKTKELMEPVIKSRNDYLMSPHYKKIFKAPGWTITPDLCGYPANENDLIMKDKSGIYKALNDMDFIVCDRHYNKERRIEGAKYICIDDQPDVIHMHTWDMIGTDKNGRNGYRQVEEEHGVPWNQETEFKFMSEAWKEGLFQPCKE
jgi:hypothetical protein